MASADESGAPRGESPDERRPQTRPGPGPIYGYKKLLLAVALLLMAAGGVGWAIAALARPVETQVQERSATSNPLAPGFAPDGGPAGGTTPVSTADDPTSQTLDDWSPVIFRLGFSFFVGFCIAYAVRMFLKISIAAVGILLLALFGLQYADVISVDWDRMGEHFDAFTAWLGTQTASFKDFITGYLPSAASAMAGLVLGFRKR